MALSDGTPIAFIPTQNADSARAFYENTLGLFFEADNGFALIFRVGPAPGLMLRIARTPGFIPASHTIFGWFVPSLEESMDALEAKGVAFLRYSYMQQDGRGAWQAPDGTRIAWFHDPDGNTLSISQQP